MSKETRCVEIIKAAGSAGITRVEIDAALGDGMDSGAALSRITRDKLAFAGGPLKWRRYFADKQWAEWWDKDGEKVRAAHFHAYFAMKLERDREAKRKRDRRYRAEKAALPKAPKVPSLDRAKNPCVVVPGRDAPVRVAPSKSVMASAQIVIPDHVKVQRGPSWTHDVRYQTPPGARVIGEFTAEWRQRRSA